MSLAPSAWRSRIGFSWYSRRGCSRSSFQRSSQMLIPILTPPDRDEVVPVGVRAGLEVARLVEDVVGRQQRFEVPAEDRRVAEQRGRVVQRPAGRPAVDLGVADDRVNGVAVGRELGDGLTLAFDEAGLEQQVLGRVAGDRELGEDDELAAGVLGLADAVPVLFEVPVEVADGRVDLGERDPHAPTLPAAAASRDPRRRPTNRDNANEPGPRPVSHAATRHRSGADTAPSARQTYAAWRHGSRGRVGERRLNGLRNVR